jgi:hypothetical protein
MLGTEGKAEAGPNPEGLPIHHEGRIQGRMNLAGGDGCASAVGGRQQDRELISAQACDCIRGTQCRAQALGHLLQEQISVLVAEGIIDLLEAIEVQEQEPERLVVLLRSQNGLLHAVLEEDAVG